MALFLHYGSIVSMQLQIGCQMTQLERNNSVWNISFVIALFGLAAVSVCIVSSILLYGDNGRVRVWRVRG